ncbi:MAG: hypothetical protein M3347_05665, partial [Armatimonadota bacterium]|nr:hypothetical protein [Armatimonadota bacterium]
MNVLRFPLVLSVLWATLGAARAEVLPYKHTQLNIYPAAQVAKGKGPVIDGNVNDWKPDAFIAIYADPSLKETFSLKFAMAYDAQGLLVAARFVDENPLLNHVDPRLDPFKGWNGDALQLRFITDAAITHPVPAHKQNSDSVVHVTTWYYTAAKMPALDVRFGMDFHGAQTFTGAQSGMIYKAFPGGYVQEGRIPWSVLKAKAPQPGQSWVMTMQPLWSNADGKNQHYIFDVVRSAAFQFQGTEGWGKANFIKPAEVQRTFLAQAAAEKQLFATATPEVKGAIPVKYNNPQKGFVSLAITNAQGQIVRTLLTKAERNVGPQTEPWDGKDDEGKPIPPGQYGLKALTHPGIKPRYVTSVMNSGNPAWGNSGKYGWGADHGVPVGAASDGEGNTYLVWTFNEGGDYLIQVDSTGQKKWGARISWGDFNGSGQDVVYDDGVLYTAKDGTGHGKIEDGKVQGGLFSYDAKTGRARPFPNGQGKMLVTQWDQKLAEGKDHGANLVALAASPDRIFASLHLENKIVALDKKTFQVAETYNVVAPLGLAYKAATKVLYAVSVDNVVAIDVANGGKISPFISTDLDHPQKIALDGAGNLYISTRGQQMQVRVFDSRGKFLRAVGKAGGRSAVGKFEPNGLYQPNGLSIDARGQLWVTETDATPKRISLWNANSGALVKDFYGSTAYAPMMAPDLDKPEEVYLHNTRFIVDYDTGKWRPDATMYRQGYLGGEMPQGAEAGYGFMGATFEVATINGRKYAYNGNGVLYALEGDRLKPVLHYGLQGWEFPRLKEGEHEWQSTRYWIDDNGDGIKDADEVHKIERTDLGNNIKQFGGTLWPGGVFIKGGKIFAPSGIGQNGVPQYPLPNAAPRILQQEGAMKTYSHWLDVWPSLQSNWKEFYAIASHPHPQGILSGGGGDSIVRFNRNGDILWRYNRVAVNFGLKAPLAKIGDLYGALRIAGQVQMPQANGGEIVSIGCYRGYFGFLNEDGLFIDQVGYDNGRGPAPNFDVFFIENFSGYFFQHPRSKKVYLFCGDVDARILELQGWDKIRRFDAGKLQITPAQYQQVIAAGSAQGGGEGAKVLSVVSGTPQLNGAAGWDKTALAEIALDENRKAKVRLSYDQKNLYARFEVPDTSPWQNAEGDWRFAFKGGDAVDIQLGMAGGGGKRTAQPGDVRVMLAPTPDGQG